MFFRITMGVGPSVAFPASARTVANWFPDTERGLVNSSYLIGVRLGQALVNAAGVGLIAIYGWRMFFVVSGLAPLLWIAAWLMILRRWEAPGPGAGAPATSNRFAFASSFGLLRHPTVLGTWAMTQACCTKRLVGTVSDIQNFGGNVAGIIAPWLTGAIPHRTGSFAPAFVLCGFILVAGALAYWWLMNERVSAPEEA